MSGFAEWNGHTELPLDGIRFEARFRGEIDQVGQVEEQSERLKSRKSDCMGASGVAPHRSVRDQVCTQVNIHTVSHEAQLHGMANETRKYEGVACDISILGKFTKNPCTMRQ